MNAPFALPATSLRLIDPADHAARIDAFLADHPAATPFHTPAWLAAVASGTGNRALALVLEQGRDLVGYLPLSEIHSPLFGRMLASTGFAVGGGVLTAPGTDPTALFAAAEELENARGPKLQNRPAGCADGHRENGGRKSGCVGKIRAAESVPRIIAPVGRRGCR